MLDVPFGCLFQKDRWNDAGQEFSKSLMPEPAAGFARPRLGDVVCGGDWAVLFHGMDALLHGSLGGVGLATANNLVVFCLEDEVGLRGGGLPAFVLLVV